MSRRKREPLPKRIMHHFNHHETVCINYADNQTVVGRITYINPIGELITVRNTKRTHLINLSEITSVEQV